MEEKIQFYTKMAGIAFEVHCQYPSTRDLCQAYLVESDSIICETICITPEDLVQERKRFLDKQNPDETSPLEFWERIHLCRRISELLPKYDRVLFHASSLAVDGRGVLFTAKSGTGKSTHTRYWRQEFGDRVTMVNDDKPFLHIGETGVTVYGTPWQGKHGLGENTSAPVSAVYWVNRGEENRTELSSSREMLPLLLQQTYTPDDPVAMAKTLALVERLSRSVKLVKLYCNLDPEAAHVALEALEK